MQVNLKFNLSERDIKTLGIFTEITGLSINDTAKKLIEFNVISIEIGLILDILEKESLEKRGNDYKKALNEIEHNTNVILGYQEKDVEKSKTILSRIKILKESVLCK